jgi:hypothetical protein
MPKKIRIPKLLRKLTNNEELVEITVIEKAIRQLDRQ